MTLPVESYARSRARASAAYPLSFSALGLAPGTTGFVIDGTVSRFWTDSRMTTLAGNLDPIGAAEDMSGNGNHLLQSNSPAKPVISVAGGITEFGLATGLYLDPGADIFATAATSIIAVAKYATNLDCYFLSTYRGGWGSGGYFATNLRRDSLDNAAFTGNSTATWAKVDGNGTGPIIYENVRSGTGANQNVLTSYTTAGVQIATATSTEGATPANALRVGVDTTSGGVNVAFLMVVNAALSAGQLTTIRSTLATKFGSW